MGRDKPKDDGKVVPLPLPKTPAPKNPEPRCTCGPSNKSCPACNS